MQAYWVKFKDRDAGCIEAPKIESVYALAKPLGEVATVKPLPYPANPRLNSGSTIPSLCFEPEKCQGRTSCPRRIACSE